MCTSARRAEQRTAAASIPVRAADEAGDLDELNIAELPDYRNGPYADIR